VVERSQLKIKWVVGDPPSLPVDPTASEWKVRTPRPGGMIMASLGWALGAELGVLRTRRSSLGDLILIE